MKSIGTRWNGREVRGEWGIESLIEKIMKFLVVALKWEESLKTGGTRV